MKDPLQLKHTPYELLGIEKGADRAEVIAAFKKGVVARRNVQELTAAHKTLLEPVERAFVDIFLYDETFVKQLVPKVWDNKSHLIARRIDIAKAWGNLHKKSFPNLSAAHSLGVLWYWWACYCEEKQLAKLSKAQFNEVGQISDALPPDELWANVIPYWAFLINSNDFLDEWSGAKDIKNGGAAKLRERLESHFIRSFHNFKERYQNNGDTLSAKRFQKYELLFSTEIKTAKELLKQDLRCKKDGKSFVISCGKMMLQDVGHLDDAVKQLSALKDSAEQGSEQYKKITLILSLLSPFTHIFVLMENKKYDEAIKEIEALPAGQRKDKELQQLLASAYLEKGKQQFSVDLYDEAFACWKKAVDTGENREEVKDAIASSCKSRGVSLQKSDTNAAIKILEKGIALTKDAELKKDLSVILCQRGINRILKAQEVLKEKPSDVNAKKEIKAGVEDIKRAVELDPANSNAKEQLRHAEEILLGQECWFCKGEKNPPDESAAVEVKMHKDINEVKYEMITLTVPRCSSCRERHIRAEVIAEKWFIGLAIGGFIAGGVIGLALGWFFIGGEVIKGELTERWIIGGVIGALIGSPIACYIGELKGWFTKGSSTFIICYGHQGTLGGLIAAVFVVFFVELMLIKAIPAIAIVVMMIIIGWLIGLCAGMADKVYKIAKDENLETILEAPIIKQAQAEGWILPNKVAGIKVEKEQA